MARVEVESEVTGKVWKMEVGVGDRVAEGDILVILESMKMEIPVESPQRGDCRRTAGGTGATGAGRSGGGRHRDLTPLFQRVRKQLAVLGRLCQTFAFSGGEELCPILSPSPPRTVWRMSA